MEEVAGRLWCVRGEFEPRLTLNIPRNVEGLQAAALQAHQVLLQRMNTKGVEDVESLSAAIRAISKLSRVGMRDSSRASLA